MNTVSVVGLIIYVGVFLVLTWPMVSAAADMATEGDTEMAKFWGRMSLVNLVWPLWILIGFVALIWAWVRLAVKGE